MMTGEESASASCKGWWVGHPEIGGLLVRAATRGKAHRLGADEIGTDYIDVYALRVPILDGTGPEGVLDWEEGKRLKAVFKCDWCGWEWARLRKRGTRQRCPECGTEVEASA